MELDLAQLSTAALVLVRIAALAMVAPLLGPLAVPVKARVLVALALVALVAPPLHELGQ